MNAIIEFLFRSNYKITLFISIFILSISLVGWFALSTIEQQTKDNSRHALSTVLLTTQEALYLWLGQRLIEVEQLASSAEVLQQTIALIEQRKKYNNSASIPALKKMREYFYEKLKRYGNQGFFIITPDYISIASMRDSNIGTTNLIYQYREKHLQQAFEGETRFIATIPSDVPLQDENGQLQEKSPTQFIVSPVYSTNKEIIAVLAVRFNPHRHFSRIVKLGRIGQSGETYAFDENAVLISDSRFDNQLKLAGEIKPGRKGMTEIRITDPGGNLINGHVSPVDKRPLTYMASHAIKGQAGFNTDGYCDYRGVRVFGVWLWDQKLGFGLTSEIDESEAMQPYYSSRLILVSVLIFTIFLMVLLINVYRVEEKQKQTIFSATVSMTQHILNNLLNQMQLFQMEAERLDDFDQDVKKLVDNCIKEGEELVEKLSSVEELSEEAIRNSIYLENKR